MLEAEETNERNPCGCNANKCNHAKNDGICDDRTCKVYKARCVPGCDGCKVKCMNTKNCKCCTPRCGCKTDCNENSNGDGKCQGLSSNCERCKVRCKPKEPCACHFCSCGTHCNGVICSCCYWCDPSNCSGGSCNGYVLGKCNNGSGKCNGHVKYDLYDKNDKDGKYGAVYKRNTENQIKCDGTLHEGEECSGNCKWLSGERDMNGNCVLKCTYCGKLCGQDNFRRCCYIAVPLFITVSAFLIFRFMFPEKFHAITTKLRAAFPSTPRHPGRSLSNLVGNRLPEEMNVDRYAAFRPKAFAGLA